ncbi:MAG: HEPN domain-containing protein [Oscillospiraceae bacterium]|nr:HEPN domain-containing protein [Oscillospiraceae bacterium]
MDNNIKELVKEWHEYAERDLMSAKHLLTMRPVPNEVIAFLSQQCAEKYIKSYLVYQNADVVRTHDLVMLIKLCAKFNSKFIGIEKQCSILLRYIADTRYPSQRFDLTEYDIKKALEYAEEIKEFVLGIIDNPE